MSETATASRAVDCACGHEEREHLWIQAKREGHTEGSSPRHIGKCGFAWRLPREGGEAYVRWASCSCANYQPKGDD